MGRAWEIFSVYSLTKKCALPQTVATEELISLIPRNRAGLPGDAGTGTPARAGGVSHIYAV